MSVISVKYNGYKKKLKYIHLSCDDNIYNSGDFVVDWFNVMHDYIVNNKYPYISTSSSIDHFIMDGAPFDGTYLYQVDKVNEKWELIYIDDVKDLLEQNEIVRKGIEFFVPEDNHMNWEELKLYCKSYKYGI
jgi:hypothetical protein